MRGAARQIGQKGRLQAAEQARSQAFRGRSAFSRASTAVNLTAVSDIGSRLEASKQLGLITERQFGIQFEQLESAGRQLETEREFLIRGLEAREEFSGKEFVSQQQQLGFREQALAAQGAAAAEQAEAGGVFGDIFGAVGSVSSALGGIF